MATITISAALFISMSQAFSPVIATDNKNILTTNNTPIVQTIDPTSDESVELMAKFLDIIEKDVAIKAIFESDNIVAKTELIEQLQETLKSKDEYKIEKEKIDEAKRIAEEEKKRQEELAKMKTIESGNFSKMGVCSSNATKSYMDYRKITSRSSAQWQLIHNSGTINVGNDGLLYSNDGFIGVALGSYYGNVGDKFKFILDTGVELNVIKIDEKADKNTTNGCAHSSDSSVIEFVVNKEKAFATFGGSNGHPGNGNFNNISQFKGNIVSAYKYNK